MSESTNPLKRDIVYTYRCVNTGKYLIERTYDFFDDPPEYISDGDHDYELLPRSPTKGWVLVEYKTDDGKKSFTEYWRINDSPDTLERGGDVYKKQFGVPLACDPYRMGSSLLGKCDKGFQEVMKHAHRTNPGSQLADKF